MPKWLLFIIFCCIGHLASAQLADSLMQREIRTGVYMLGSSISENLFGSNTGYDLEVGVWQERKLLEQVYFSYGAGAEFRQYNDTGILVDTTPISMNVRDTAIISHFFDVSRREINLSTQASIRFVYVTNPNIYLILGGGPEITIQQKVSNQYSFTRYTDDEFFTIGESSDNPVTTDQDNFKINAVNFRLDIGLGIELNRFNIEVINRFNNVHGLGLRIRYTFDTLRY